MSQTSAARVGWRAGPVLAVLAGLALSLAACGNNPSETGVASLPAGTASATASAGTGGDPLKYAQCMREHGITKFPDPGADGVITIQPGLGLDPNSEKFKAATEACKSQAPAGADPPDAKKADPQEQQRYLAFAKCMREHGISDYPDPATRDDGSLSLLIPKDVDINSAHFKQAQQTCKSLLPNGGQPPGAGS
jgi:hypothetical protein